MTRDSFPPAFPSAGINPRALAASLPRSATLLAGPLASPVPWSLLAHSNTPMYPRMLLPTEFILKSRRPACRALQIPPFTGPTRLLKDLKILARFCLKFLHS